MRFLAILCAGLILALGCRKPDEAAIPAAPAYAGSESCAECHQQAHVQWKGSHHAGAQRHLADNLDRQAFEPPREIRHASQTSFAEIRDGKLTLTTMGPDGQPHPFVPVEAFGVYPLWQYLIPFDGGRLQTTELAFDPDKKEWFNVYNDEDRKAHEWGHWSNRGMNWNSMCATCHTTNFQKNYRPATDSYESTYLERGVGCEQCHGPMKAHDDWQRRNGNRKMPPVPEQPVGMLTAGTDRVSATRQRMTDDPTLKPMDWSDYFGTCAACHSRRADLTGAFRAGENFFDHYDLVQPDLSQTFYPDGQILDEDFEISAFTTSYMHNNGIRCTDCHSPHTGKRRLEGDALCQSCHFRPVTTKIAIDADHSHHPAGKGGSLCTDCHMPQTVYMARHWRHDHGMTIPDPLLTKEHGIPNACTRCHNDKSVDWSLQYCEQWYGKRMERPTRTRAQLLARVKKGDMAAVPPLLHYLPQEKNPAWRGIICKFLIAVVDSGSRELIDETVAGLLDVLKDEAPIAQAGALEALDAFVTAGLPDALAGYVRRQVTPKLGSDSRVVRIKAAWLLRRDLPENSPARADLVASLTYNEDQPLGAFRWAQFLCDSGRGNAAVPWFEKAVKWDPNSAAFRHAFATALDALGRPEDALQQAVKAAELEPNQGMHRYALGLLYGELGRLPEARDALRAAVEKDPGQARYWYNLGSVEAKLGSFDPALTALERAEELDPATADYPFARAQILLAAGRVDQARAAVEKLLRAQPGNETARQLLMQLDAAAAAPHMN